MKKAKQTVLWGWGWGIVFILVLVCLWLLYLHVVVSSEPYENSPQITLVVSYYNEDLSFLDEKPFSDYRVVLYNKGTTKPTHPNIDEIVDLPNVGVCNHTYLYHIIENYEQLDDIVIFLPGSCMDAHKRDKTLATIRKVEETHNSVFYVSRMENGVEKDLYDFHLDYWKTSNSKNQELNAEGQLKQCEIRPFGEFYKKTFQGVYTPVVNYGGIFAVSKEHMLQTPKRKYEELIRYVSDMSNTECAHYLERVVVTMFMPVPDECFYE